MATRIMRLIVPSRRSETGKPNSDCGYPRQGQSINLTETLTNGESTMAKDIIITECKEVTPLDATVIIGIEQEMYSMPMPRYETDEAAGFDLCSAHEVTIPPKTHAVIKTGLHMDIPMGYHVEVRSRSGLAAKHGVFVLNSPGTIDSDYTGEICVILCNLGDEPFFISKGDRIAQAVVMKHEIASLVKVSKITRQTKRGSDGFGSTGV